MTDSSTPCCANVARPRVEQRRALLRGLAAAAGASALVRPLGALASPGPVRGTGSVEAVSADSAWQLAQAGAEPNLGGSVEVVEFSALALDDGVWVRAQLRLDLPSVVESALAKGVTMHFVLELELVRRRWYWADRTLASVSRPYRLSYQPLGRRWRLQQGTQAAPATTGESFDTLSDALRALERVGRERITDQVLGDVGGVYVSMRFRLDTAQMPRPLQIGALGRTDWSLAVERSVAVVADLGRSGASLP
jgi:hypothetical protein